MSRRDSSRSTRARGSALVASLFSLRRSASGGSCGAAQRGGDLVAGHGGELPARAELGGQAVEHAGVGAARVGAGRSRRGQERVGRLGEGDGAAPDRGHRRALLLPCHAASAVPLVMYRITCASRAGAAGSDRLLARGCAVLMYRITAHYPKALSVDRGRRASVAVVRALAARSENQPGRAPREQTWRHQGQPEAEAEDWPPFRNRWVTVRHTGTTPKWGCLGVGDGDGKLPSLADTIAAVRRELNSAQAAGEGQPIQFRTGPVELEFEVAVTRTGGGQAGVQLWVLTLGGKGELAHATTQRIKLTLQP